jgi:TPR repeat protein
LKSEQQNATMEETEKLWNMFGCFKKQNEPAAEKERRLNEAVAALQNGDVKGGTQTITLLALEGYPEAEYTLGDINEFGFRNLPEAAKWYEYAAEHGHAKAQRALADFLMAGKVGAPDPERAFKWYTKAAAQGVPEAQFVLGEFYRAGNFIPKDLDQAVHWYEQAKKNGFEHAETRLQLIRDGMNGSRHS